MTPTVHIVEPGGKGGVYQHAAALASAVAEAGMPVVLHTAADCERLPASGGGVRRHPCFWRFGNVRPALARHLVVAGAWLVRGVPSCLAHVHRGDIVQVEGWFWPALLAPLVIGARLRGARVVLSPHNTFSRRRPWEATVVRWMARRADAVIVLSAADRRRVHAWDIDPIQASLFVQPVEPDPRLIGQWRKRWGAAPGQPVVLFAGQIRPDKGLDVLVRAVARLGREAVVTSVVGEDVTGLADARALAERLQVTLEVEEGFQPLDRFVAAVAAADVVVCPYRVASQSAVLALARALGRRSVATDVGGLAEAATVVVSRDDPAGLAEGISRALGQPPPAPVAPPGGEALDAYLAAYGLREPAAVEIRP